MKRTILLSVVLAALLSIACGATGLGVKYNWYCPHKGNGKAPECPAEMDFIEKENGIFLDRGAAEDPDHPVIYLTFDAGYENGNIEKILNVMKEENVKGSFFILKNLVQRNSGLVKRMADEGHAVCNHTANHKDMTLLGESAFRRELRELEEIYRGCTGKELSRFYRPPEGKFTKSNLRLAHEMGYDTVFWSFAYADWDNDRQPDPAAAKAKILSNTHNGEIILLHPTSSTNAAILSELIKEWKSMGFRFATLDELKK